jgi:hypothetical protein
MKVVQRNYGINMDTVQRQIARANAAEIVRTRGTSRKPRPPRNVICQSGPRGILVTWNLPAGYTSDIQRWRIYRDNESTLYHELTDRGTRQFFIEATAGSTPPTVNVFVSSLNNLGVESAKVQAQGAAAAEAGAPAMPSAPPGFTSGGAGGGNTGTNYGGGRQNNTR